MSVKKDMSLVYYMGPIKFVYSSSLQLGAWLRSPYDQFNRLMQATKLAQLLPFQMCNFCCFAKGLGTA